MQVHGECSSESVLCCMSICQSAYYTSNWRILQWRAIFEGKVILQVFQFDMRLSVPDRLLGVSIGNSFDRTDWHERHAQRVQALVQFTPQLCMQMCIITFFALKNFENVVQEVQTGIKSLLAGGKENRVLPRIKCIWEVVHFLASDSLQALL